MPDVTIGNITVGNDLPLVLISGPCQIESAAHARPSARPPWSRSRPA